MFLLKIASIFYLSTYVLAMVLPREIPRREIASESLIQNLFQDLFYLAGNLEMIGNTLLLVPIFLILVRYFGNEKPLLSLAICVFLSACAESIQSVIPGRVSSLTDFALNSFGAFFVFSLYTKIDAFRPKL